MRLDDDFRTFRMEGPAAAVMGGLQIGGGLLSMHGQRQADRAQRRAARHNQEVLNARAMDAKRRAEATEYRQRLQTSRLVGKQIAAIGGSGALIGVGSAADIVAETYALGELDALTIRNNAAREAWGLELQSRQVGFQSASRSTAAGIGQFGTAIGTAASAYGEFKGL